MKVKITADVKATMYREVEMSEEDFADYESICEQESGMSMMQMDRAIFGIASKYGFDFNDVSFDDEPEEVIFTKIIEQSPKGE